MKVLLADFHPERASALAERIAAQGFDVQCLGPDELLADAVLAGAADLVILEMAVSDRDSLPGLREISTRLPVVVFVDQQDEGFMEEAIAAGVSSYNLVGGALPEITPIIRMALALFRRLRALEADLHKAEAGLEERRLIERAKARLMQQCQIGEPEAYRRLRKRAMDQGRRLRDIAAEILAAAAEQ